MQAHIETEQLQGLMFPEHSGGLFITVSYTYDSFKNLLSKTACYGNLKWTHLDKEAIETCWEHQTLQLFGLWFNPSTLHRFPT